MDGNSIRLGMITGVHGLQGYVRVKTFTAQPDNLMGYGDLHFNNGLKTTITDIKGIKGDTIIAKLEHITNRNQAELFKGQSLFITREQLPNLSEDEYYHNDLINLTVYDDQHNKIGIVIAIHNYGASDILEIKNHEDQYFMVPFINDAIQSVDVATQSIIVLTEFVTS